MAKRYFGLTPPMWGLLVVGIALWMNWPTSAPRNAAMDEYGYCEIPDGGGRCVANYTLLENTSARNFTVHADSWALPDSTEHVDSLDIIQGVQTYATIHLTFDFLSEITDGFGNVISTEMYEGISGNLMNMINTACNRPTSLSRCTVMVVYQSTNKGGALDTYASIRGEPALPNITLPNCTPSWSCDTWSTCQDGEERRHCNDHNYCGSELNEPNETRSCGSGNSNCTPNWTCGDWSPCSNSTKVRSCTDAKACGITTNEPSTIATCTGGAKAFWEGVVKTIKGIPVFVDVLLGGLVLFIGFKVWNHRRLGSRQRRRRR